MKIGIPKALFFYDYLPFFETFLKKLGFEVIVFEKTSQKVLEKGKELLSDEVCLPMKILAGKTWFLKDKVDFVFLPSFHSENKKEFFCAKYIGLPDLIKNRVFPNILDIKIESFEKRELFLSFFSLFKKFGKKRNEIELALKEAFLAQKNNEIKEITPIGDAGGLYIYRIATLRKKLLGLMKSSQNQYRVIDRDGVIRLQIARGDAIITPRQNLESSLREFIERHTEYGDAGRSVPGFFIVFRGRILDLSGLMTAGQIISLANVELAKVSEEEPVALLVKKS